MRKPLRNLGASVRARLQNLAQRRGQTFDLLLIRFVLERLLYRLSITRHRDRFVLKGAMLMTSWFDDPHRPTRDLDLLGFGEPDPTAMLEVFREICGVAADDGVAFDIGGMTAEAMREDQEYLGLRIKTYATLAGARLRVSVDIGFGDAIGPEIEERELPVLLDLPPPRLRVYARETVVAEKFQAIVALGLGNTRLKDYYDIWLLGRSYEFDGDSLAVAIDATFSRRNTPIPVNPPDGLTLEFAKDPARVQQWAAFIRDVGVPPGSLAELIAEIAAFLMPHADRARARRSS